MSAPFRIENLQKKVESYGLSILGACSVEESDAVYIVNITCSSCILLIGNIGSHHYDVFCSSQSHVNQSLDEFSEDILSEIFLLFDCSEFYFPSQKPYMPFQQWGRRAKIAEPSLLGLDIHPIYGLWFAYRAALIIPSSICSNLVIENENNRAGEICKDCVQKPCLSACPVEAIKITNFEYQTCQKYIVEHRESDCTQYACAARLACPKGQRYRYHDAHLAFHSKAYFDAHC